MLDHLFIFLFVFYYVGFVNCGYPPIGDEVQSGSVLLPSSRRGRYLANIARRQAVDGTGIKFNKDADRMNAEAKKKVDVLSEELLPYIIAEQERRTTLYKRVMAAIQNGEKGVTIAEIRNKPPAIIRKGLMYRCPSNRAPKEPDGSGGIMCEDKLDPTPILFESCLSAEDKELYVADNTYFFCNRHKIEGPDLPRNGSNRIGCSPSERTSLNYTSQKCALEDTDDVVVHYRYYPDRSYKFVSELDPDREVCEHWNPCQVGYIFSLPGPDQATLANELWHDYSTVTDEDVSREELVPPVPEDNKNETTLLAQNYVTSTRRVLRPKGYDYRGVGKYLPNGLRTLISRRDGVLHTDQFDNIEVISKPVGYYIKITMIFRPMRAEDATTYFVRFEEYARRGNFAYIPLVTLSMGQTLFTPQVLLWLPPQQLINTSINFTCAYCVLTGIVMRAADGFVRNVDVNTYHLRKFNDDKGVEQSVINLDIEPKTPRDYGDYYLMIKNDDCGEEQIKALTLKAPDIAHEDLIQMKRLRAYLTAEPRYENVTYACADCEIMDVVCRGSSVVAHDGFLIDPASKTISIQVNMVGCVYMAMFKVGDDTYRKIVAVFTNKTPDINISDGKVVLLPPPEEDAPFEHKVHFRCTEECILDMVSVNGIPLETITRRSNVGSVGYFLPEDGAVTIGFTEYTSVYEGMYQGLFKIGGNKYTKNLMEIGPEENQQEEIIQTGPDFFNLQLVLEETGDTTLTPESLDNAEPEGRKHQRRSGGKTEQFCTVHILRDSLPTGHSYKQKTVEYACPGGQLVAVSCRGQNVTTGLGISTNNIVSIDFDHFEDKNACVYKGIFKIGQTEHKKTLAVLENSSPMINVTVSAVVPPPPSGEFKHKVVYTCNVAKCDPAMIYINDKILKSDDRNHFYSYNSEMVKGNDKEIMTVTINFSIKPFTKEYEGVYQLVVTNGIERVTKNIMEIGALV